MTWMDHAPKRLTTSLRTLVLRATAALEPSRIPRRPRQRSAEAIFVATQQGPFDDTISDAARHWKLDPFLLKGLLANESKLEPVRYGKRCYARRKGSLVVVAGGAMGIAQFTGSGIRAVNALRRRRQRAGAKVLFFDAHLAMIPSRAISAAAELLAHLVRTYGRDGGITAYNSGVVGGLAVYRYGFYRARSEGRLSRVGIYEIQGYRFLLNVLRKANWYRAQAGLPPLEAPDAKRPASRRYVNARNKTPLG
ncbi:MAG: transglycosylase SLT domain-containing protein [Deltaproteobacteria bacterium]|nr:transglycosylase SLT domain-containing protein [Deltaproteobacteria bacterium]